MKKSDGEIIEVGLEVSDINFFTRSLKSLKQSLLLVPLAIIVYMIFIGYNHYLFLAIFALLILLFILSLILNFKILYKVKFYIKLDIVELISIRFNRINQELVVKRSVRENFGYRYSLWQIKVLS